MEIFIQWLLVVGILLFFGITMSFSVRARRALSPAQRGLFTARMNMSMGIMLILLALIQMVMFTSSTVRVIIGTLFLLLGLFNLFAGLRNHSHYSKLMNK